MDPLSEWNPWWITGEVPNTWLGKRREVASHLLSLASLEEVKLISGPRRAGKTTTVFQVINELLKKEEWQRIIYVNFEDPLIDVSVFQTLRYYKFVFLDEVKAEHFPWIRKLYEFGINVFATSSTSAVLHEGLKYLEGRAVQVKVFPLSFHEVSLWKNRNDETLVDEMLKFGAFPRIVLEQQPSVKRMLLASLVETIGVKDVGGREGYEFLHLLLSELPSLFSLQRLEKTLRRRHGYVSDMFEKVLATDVVFQVPKFGYSGRIKLAFPRKIYSIDNGIAMIAKKRFEIGKLLENLVASELRKADYALYYHKHSRECDFIVEAEGKTFALQVTVEPDKPREREGLEEAKSTYSIPGTVVHLENLLGFLNAVPNSNMLFKWIKQMERKD